MLLMPWMSGGSVVGLAADTHGAPTAEGCDQHIVGRQCWLPEASTVPPMLQNGQDSTIRVVGLMDKASASGDSRLEP